MIIRVIIKLFPQVGGGGGGVVHKEVQKRLKIGNENIIGKSKMKNRYFQKRFFLTEMFRIKVHSNILISLLKTNLKKMFSHSQCKHRIIS